MEKKTAVIFAAAIACICSILFGCGESGNSGTGSSLVTSSSDQTAVSKRPDVPTGVTATGGINTVTLAWNAVNGADSYNVYWSSAPGVTPASGTKITGATSPLQHEGLFVSQTYFYVVTAVNNDGESVASSQVATVSATDGANLYAVYCATCHGDMASTSIKNGTADKINAAIAANSGGMGALSSLWASQIDTIAAKLPCH